MKVNERNMGIIQNAINSVFYIKNHSDDDPIFQGQLQEIINLLFEKFPGLMPLPDRSLAEQGDDVTIYIQRAIRS